MNEVRGIAGLGAMLERSRQLVATSRAAMATSRKAITVSVRRATHSETRRASCLTELGLVDCDATELAQRLRSALEQAAIDREVGFTTAKLEGLESEHRGTIVGVVG